MKTAGMMVLAFVLALGAAGGYVYWTETRIPPRDATSDALDAMREADEAMREAGTSGLWDILRWTYADWTRRVKVRRIVEAGHLDSAEDYYNAAFLLQHGSTPDDFKQARELAREARERGKTKARRLQALAEDRYRTHRGEKQKYGSQIECTPEGGWQLKPVDPETTDAERAAMGVEPLAEIRAKVDRINEITGGDCTMDAETMRRLERIMRPDTPDAPDTMTSDG